MGAIFYTSLVLMQVSTLILASPEKCSPSDSSCLKAAAQLMTPTFTDGIPELGTDRLDVMHVDDIKVDLAGLKLNMTNNDVKGLRNAVIDEIKVDLDKKQLVLLYHADVVISGQYKAAGRMLVLPISGDGDYKIELKNYQSEVTVPFTIEKNKEGKDMIRIKEFRSKFEVKDNAHYTLTNLFNGNKLLSDALLKFMNENWKLLSQEFGGAVLVKPNKKIFHSIKKYLQSKPLDEIVAV